MARLVHKATDGLGPEAVRVMVAGFRAKKTYRAIAMELAGMGEVVPERTIARRGHEFYAEESRRRAAREQAVALVAAMKENNLQAEEILQAFATEKLMADPEEFTSSDPVKVQRLNLKATEERRKERELALRAREVAVNERRVALLEQRAVATEEVLKASAGAELTPEQQQKIREIYGLS